MSVIDTPAPITERPTVPPSEGALTASDIRAFLIFSTWTIAGLFLDGWAHNHHKPETFFTPWHAVLYSGFTAGMAWSVFEGQRERRAGRATRTPGGWLTAFGVGLFVAGAVGDFGWHQLFGIEKNIAALLSPTHLVLMTGGVLLVSTPMRAAWVERTGRRLEGGTAVAVVMSLTLSVAVVAFFLMFVSPFRPWLENVRAMGIGGRLGLGLNEQIQTTTISAVLITNALFMGAALHVLRRWHLPFGALTAFFTIVAVAMSGLDSFRLLPLVVGAPIGGLVADTLISRLGTTSPSTRGVRALAGVTPVALWLPYFAVLKLHYGLNWQIHLWAGTVFLAVLSGLALSVLSFPPPVPATVDPLP